MSKYSKENPRPAVYYLVSSANANDKLIGRMMITTMIVVYIFAIVGHILPFVDLFSESLLNIYIFEFPVWMTVLPLPIILLWRSKPHKEWQETHKNTMKVPRKSITTKEFTTATYLEIFLSTIIASSLIVINWGGVLWALGPDVREILFTIGVFNLGFRFFHIWMMASLVFIFRFAKLAKVARGAILMLLCFFASLLATMGLQSLLTLLEIPYAIAAAICAILGLIVLRIGCAVTVRLHEVGNFRIISPRKRTFSLETSFRKYSNEELNAHLFEEIIYSRPDLWEFMVLEPDKPIKDSIFIQASYPQATSWPPKFILEISFGNTKTGAKMYRLATVDKNIVLKHIIDYWQKQIIPDVYLWEDVSYILSK